MYIGYLGRADYEHIIGKGAMVTSMCSKIIDDQVVEVAVCYKRRLNGPEKKVTFTDFTCTDKKIEEAYRDYMERLPNFKIDCKKFDDDQKANVSV